MKWPMLGKLAMKWCDLTSTQPVKTSASTTLFFILRTTNLAKLQRRFWVYKFLTSITIVSIFKINIYADIPDGFILFKYSRRKFTCSLSSSVSTRIFAYKLLWNLTYIIT